MKNNLSQLKTYRDFTRAREEALEALLAKNRVKVSDAFGDFLFTLMQAAGELHPSFTSDDRNAGAAEHLMRRIQPKTKQIADFLGKTIRQLRVVAAALAKAGEVEAIARATGRKPTLRFSAFDKLSMEGYPALAGGSIEGRMRLYLDKLARRIASQAQAAGLERDAEGRPLDRADFMRRVAQALPKAKPAPKRKNLQRVQAREAKKPKQDLESLAMIGVMDRTTYDLILDDYKSEYVPRGRSPSDIAEIKNVIGPSGQTRSAGLVYDFEVERDLTNEFVAAVRLGQVQAAKENNITDFVWIAVLDDRTDECCEKRDGLLTSEIKLKLEGPWADDDCQAVVPPAHFNCRCTLAPAMDNIPDRPEIPFDDFEAWLNDIPTT